MEGHRPLSRGAWKTLEPNPIPQVRTAAERGERVAAAPESLSLRSPAPFNSEESNALLRCIAIASRAQQFKVATTHSSAAALRIESKSLRTGCCEAAIRMPRGGQLHFPVPSLDDSLLFQGSPDGGAVVAGLGGTELGTEDRVHAVRRERHRRRNPLAGPSLRSAHWIRHGQGSRWRDATARSTGLGVPCWHGMRAQAHAGFLGSFASALGANQRAHEADERIEVPPAARSVARISLSGSGSLEWPESLA